MLEFLWLFLLLTVLFCETDTTGWSAWPRDMTTVSWLRDICAWSWTSLWRHCSLQENFVLQSILLAFPAVTFALSTPGVHILVKGWETFCNWRDDSKTRGQPGCLPGAFPRNRPSSFPCRNKTDSKADSVFCFHGDKGHTDCAKRSYFPREPFCHISYSYIG